MIKKILSEMFDISNNLVDRQLEEELLNAFVASNDEIGEPSLRPEFVTNDPEHGKKVLSIIEDELTGCKSFAISVAFITLGGITPLKQTLRELCDRNIPGRILTTDYQYFSDPRALRDLASLGNIEVRMFLTDENEGFHTKGYIFESGDTCRFLIGSSNLTLAALSTNREWNARLVSKDTGAFARILKSEFETLWNHSKTHPLSEVIDEYERLRRERGLAQREVMRQLPLEEPQVKLHPNAMQSTFVEKVRRLVDAGQKKALLISATGTGKTYAAAFAVKELNPKRMLFVVHREFIARQAMKSFRRVVGEKDDRIFGFYGGNERNKNADYVFAMVQTLSKDDSLAEFDRDAFDVIVVDEVHRAAAKSYSNIMKHFSPRLWLGMTATPERTDGQDVYAMFDHNIACEIRLKTALEERLLCPFHYFGVRDLTVGGVVVEDTTDFNRLVADERVKNILDQATYFGYSGDRVKGLVFCSRNDECSELSRLFNERGYATCALSGKDDEATRNRAVYRLTQGAADNRLDYIFTVDIFAEGVDIPEINQIIMLRPTNSAIVFVQQLGRGLRKADNKEFVVVLDFIGNYKNNFLIPVALSDDRSYDKDATRRFVGVGRKMLPGSSSVHFDPVVRRKIYEAIDSADMSDLKLLRDSYLQLKAKLGRIPKLADFDTYGSIDIIKTFEKKSLGSYYAFLVKYEKDYCVRISATAEQMLRFLCSKLGRGQRASEAIVLQAVFEGQISLAGVLKERLFEKYSRRASQRHIDNVMKVLSNGFVRNENEKKTNAGCVFVEDDGNGDWQASELLRQEMQDQNFCGMLSELADFMLMRYEERYAHPYADTDLVLYQKYTYEDVCRLLNWPVNYTAQNIGGYVYEKTTKTLPVFVNYHKDEEAIAYGDRFVTPRHLVAYSKTKRSVNSPDADHIYKRTTEDRENKIYLFVRRNKTDKNEAKAFYFLGEMQAVGRPEATIEKKTGNNVFVINYRLDVPVRDDLYAYIMSTDDDADGQESVESRAEDTPQETTKPVSEDMHELTLTND